MTGIPFLGGFIVKVLLSEAAMLAGTFRMTAALLVLAASAVLNTLYFLKTVITLYRAQDEPAAQGAHVSSAFKWGMCCFIALNMTLGIFSQPVVTAIRMGLSMFD